MHGRVQSKGEGFRNLRRSNSQHMQSVPPLVTTNKSEASVVDNCSLRSASGDSFFQDGRRISVGDCALFKPPQDSPPFVGLIRWLKAEKENNLQLGVNWLYRSAELNLGKGVLVEGTPNEVFYSFHTDEISAASLLHPCKVAFLPKGVQLPTGASSFVCRRVYDTTNKCLWWLTDQDFIDDRQEEVDELLHKTRTEMHAMLQSGGRSPKQANGPGSAAQLKPAIDSGQNSGNSLNSQVRGKKRERGDRNSDPIKRERSSKADDADSLQCKIESNLKSEISLITEKGGVVDLEGVDKLIQLMKPVRTERKMDLSSHSMLAGVMAATDKVDCLNRFVQLRGLPILDEWLQDARKGRIGDGSNAKDRDETVEEFLLVLLRALDKLPVNLHALQMCNIGKSVNHLRSHKNLEIQRKARTLIDTWKKRVEAEMISNDAKSGSTQGVSWPSKSRPPEASQGGGVRTPSGSDVSIKNSSTQNSASKTVSSRSSHGDANVKSASSPPGTGKQASPPSIGQENHPRNSAGVTEDVPQIKEDRGNIVNQSQNCSPSYSVKDDAKSTTHKMSSSGTRNKKTSGYHGISGNASQKETNTSRSSSSQKVASLEKRAHSALSSERNVEGAVSEGTNHKLIVKIPNRVRSPSQGSDAGLVDDSTYISGRVSSPLLPVKNETLERASEDKIEASRYSVSSDVNVDSCQDCDLKDASAGSADGAGPRSAVPDEGQSMAAGDSKRVLHSSSFSPMNALIESCVKYSEVNTSPSLEDDGGMNLLASVATREMSRSDLVPTVDSTEMKTPAAEEVCFDVGESKPSTEDLAIVDQSQTYNDAESDSTKKYEASGGLRCEDSSHVSKHVQSTDRRSGISHGSEDIHSERLNVSEISSRDMSNNAETKLVAIERLNEITGTDSLLVLSAEKARDRDPDEKMLEDKATFSNVIPDYISKFKSGRFDDVEAEEKVASDHGKAGEVKTIVGVAAGDCKSDSNGQNNTTLSVEKLSSVNMYDFPERLSNEKPHHTAFDQNPLPGVDDANAIESHAKHARTQVTKSGSNFDQAEGTDVADETPDAAASDMENKVTINHTSTAERQRLVRGDHEATDQKTDSRDTKSASVQSDGEGDCASTAADVSSHTAGTSDVDGKMKFDLNEGLGAEEGKSCDPVNLMSACAPSVQMINSLTYQANSMHHVHSSPITVASAAKGPFVPPDDLLRSKGELGWKGSAATSAFRPAEPRRAPETTQASTSMSCSDASTSNKPGRFRLDIDLNVPDEGLVEEMASTDFSLAVDSTAHFINDRALSMNEGRSSRPVLVHTSGGLDLDLNAIDETNDNGNCSTSTNRNTADPAVYAKQIGAGLPSGDVRRAFDLNDGPSVDEGGAELFLFNHQVKGGSSGIPPHQPSSSGLRMTAPGLGNFSSSWFPAGNIYAPMAVPSVLPDRRDHHPFPVFPNTAQRSFASTGPGPFTPEGYRGSVLSSSPAVNFPSGPFHFPVFPFGTSFPVPSSASPASYGETSTGPRMFATPPLHHQQLLGPVGTISSQFPRPYVVNLPESSSNSNGLLDSSRKWSRSGLDLNAGPGGTEVESNREEMFSLATGQQSVGSSSRALTEEQARIYSASNGVLKRKEPEGGVENESFRFKHNSWQ